MQAFDPTLKKKKKKKKTPFDLDAAVAGNNDNQSGETAAAEAKEEADPAAGKAIRVSELKSDWLATKNFGYNDNSYSDSCLQCKFFCPNSTLLC